MGVYNPNMEMPRNCTECLEFKDDCEHYWDNYCTHESRPNDCPLIEIDLVRCGECKYFNLNEWDETICGVPIIVAHEICHRWGDDGHQTSKNGFCFIGERRADDKTEESRP